MVQTSFIKKNVMYLCITNDECYGRLTGYMSGKTVIFDLHELPVSAPLEALVDKLPLGDVLCSDSRLCITTKILDMLEPLDNISSRPIQIWVDSENKVVKTKDEYVALYPDVAYQQVEAFDMEKSSVLDFGLNPIITSGVLRNLDHLSDSLYWSEPNDIILRSDVYAKLMETGCTGLAERIW